MYLKSLHLQNLLSFGPDSPPISFGPLNVLIGPNGSGKSNLIEAIGLLAAAPNSLSDAIRHGGGIAEWLWKGCPETPIARIKAVMNMPVKPALLLEYRLAFSQSGQRFELQEEHVSTTAPPEHPESVLHFGSINGRPHIRMQDALKEVDTKELKPHESILSQRRDPDIYPALYLLEGTLRLTKLYRDWNFGRYTPPRLPQPADLPNRVLLPDGQNLGLILNQIRKVPEAKDALMKNLGAVYEGVRDVDISVEGGTVQIFLQERNWVIPASRLSDGTLRWLWLLALLLNPNYQLLTCIEEPEMGLHPDLLPLLAQLLRDASNRMQLIVTTHSDVLVDALSDTPESVIVCEKHEGSTTMQRLDKSTLSEWLEKYSLGQLWRSGEIGGNRW
jgi:predicted ATPase